MYVRRWATPTGAGAIYTHTHASLHVNKYYSHQPLILTLATFHLLSFFSFSQKLLQSVAVYSFCDSDKIRFCRQLHWFTAEASATAWLHKHIRMRYPFTYCIVQNV